MSQLGGKFFLGALGRASSLLLHTVLLLWMPAGASDVTAIARCPLKLLPALSLPSPQKPGFGLLRKACTKVEDLLSLSVWFHLTLILVPKIPQRCGRSFSLHLIRNLETSHWIKCLRVFDDQLPVMLTIEFFVSSLLMSTESGMKLELPQWVLCLSTNSAHPHSFSYLIA